MRNCRLSFYKLFLSPLLLSFTQHTYTPCLKNAPPCCYGLPLPVSLLTVLVSLTFQRPVNATFRPRSTICLEIYSLTPSLYIPSTDTNFGLISHRPKSRLRPNQTIVTMGWRVFETQCTYSDSCIWLGPFFRDMNNHSFSRISKLNYIKYGQYTALHNFVLDFKYVAPFRNYAD